MHKPIYALFVPIIQLQFSGEKLIVFVMKKIYCASLLLLLLATASCEEQRNLAYEKYSGERHGAPVVGGRRAPMLNPNGPRLSNAAPVNTQPAALTPYDQYVAAANEAPATQAAPAARKSFGSDQAPASPRKRFKGAAAATPVTLAPEPAPAPVAAPAPVPEDENGVFLPDMPQQRSDITTEMQVAQLSPAAGGDADADDDIHLSSVPKMPVEFEAIKQEKDAAEQELTNEHDKAMEEKEKLSEEPSELKPASLPQVEGMLKDLNAILHSNQPIVQATR
jgi:hypothetical protein